MGMARPGTWQGVNKSREQGNMVKTGFKVICGAPLTHKVTELIMMVTKVITMMTSCPTLHTYVNGFDQLGSPNE